MMMRRDRRIPAGWLAFAFALTLGLVLPVFAQEAPPAPPLAIEAVEIQPAAPGADTLCQLRVKVKNGGGQIASRLRFTVEINGAAVPVYAHQMYLEPLAPGAVTTVRLYNFWTTESDRPVPADGKLTVKVSLDEAAWVTVQKEGKTEVWKPAGAVPGLPVSGRLSVPLAGVKAAPPPKSGG